MIKGTGINDLNMAERCLNDCRGMLSEAINNMKESKSPKLKGLMSSTKTTLNSKTMARQSSEKLLNAKSEQSTFQSNTSYSFKRIQLEVLTL